MRVNHRIRAGEVRVIQDGESLVLPIRDALARAAAQGLDLVEVDARAAPPVCKILDLGRHLYEEKKKKRARAPGVKEITLRPKTHARDLAFKARAVRRLLDEGHAVKITVRMRGREAAHPGKAREPLDAILALAGAEAPRITSDGRSFTALVAPRR